jgi:IS4 transposase
MSSRELGRVEVLARIRSKRLRIVAASRLLGVSYGQAKRKWIPPANHPWRGAILRAQQKRELKATTAAERAHRWPG